MTAPGDAYADQRSGRIDDYTHYFATAATALAAAIRTEATDGAEIVSHLLATVAANLGGMHTITRKRPGSWEADYVNRFLASTVGPDSDYLLTYRTDPIEVVECVPVTLEDLGIDHVYDDAFLVIEQAEEATLGADPDDAALDASAERVDRADALIEQLRLADEAAYQAAFKQQVQAAAQKLVSDEHLPATVPIKVRFVTSAAAANSTGAGEDWCSVEYRLWETARTNTPPPGFDRPLAQLGPDDFTVEAMRQARRLPLQRIANLAHYQER
ncbi:hypothetical protein [Actinopolymorpha sp. B9G3]|uniref:hypothetical protein n=1 Tax=Actinopolymorpha sp. B9G3 TaxID=3158970 RepID=UPI0032D8D36A